jgi:hypothetical protein
VQTHPPHLLQPPSSWAKSPLIKGGILSPEDAPLAPFKDGKTLFFPYFKRAHIHKRHNVLPLVSSVRGACYTRQAGREEAAAAFAAALLVPGLVKEL